MPSAPGPLAKYADFLSFLLTIGPKLQALWPALQAWIAATSTLVTAFRTLLPAPVGPTSGGLSIEHGGSGEFLNTLSLYDPTAEEIELEGQVGTLIIPASSGTQAFVDFATIRMLWQLAKAYPGVRDFLSSLVRSK